MDNIVKIPPTDKWVGSCPECGKAIWESYLVPNEGYETKPYKRYRCIECKGVFNGEEIIPF